MPRICQLRRSETSSRARTGVEPTAARSKAATKSMGLRIFKVSSRLVLKVFSYFLSVTGRGLRMPGRDMPRHDQPLRHFDRIIENKSEHPEHEDVGKHQRRQHLAVEHQQQIA